MIMHLIKSVGFPGRTPKKSRKGAICRVCSTDQTGLAPVWEWRNSRSIPLERPHPASTMGAFSPKYHPTKASVTAHNSSEGFELKSSDE